MINKKIEYYINGNPIETDAVVELDDFTRENPMKISEIEDFDLEINEDKIKLSYKFSKEDMVLGFGETMKGLNKRNSIVTSFCTDEPSHLPNKKSLYGAHNFFIIYGKTIRAYFIDFPGKIEYDIGFFERDIFNITIEGLDLIVYKISGDSLKSVSKSFLEIIGQAYVPPKWAFGYQQSRWSYETSEDIRQVARKMREAKIPCDTIYLDIDYMERFKDFTICNDKFPNFKSLVEEMKDSGFRLIPIIDAGVKIEKGYDLYEEGILGGHFCEDENGRAFVAAVWPGLVHFPDFFKEDTRKWFASKYQILTSCGIEGFWNDMNEPTIFYSPNRLGDFYKHVDESRDKNLDIYSFFSLKDKLSKLSNSMDDYKSFYHYINNKPIRHDKVHNLYGYYMTRSAYDGLESIDKDKRYLLFSRASYIGMHRYGGIWMGDNDSWWEHIELSIKLLPALNMCGFMYVGPDTGGFQGDASSELLIRFMQFSLFTPLMRNHSALSTRDQEPYAFDKESVDILRNIIELRYSLIPYLYSTYMTSVKDRLPYAKNLIMEYDDSRVREIEDQLLIGDDLMIAPIYKQNASGRMVYLPEDMLFWRASSPNIDNLKVLKKGDHFISTSLEELSLFIRPDKGIILGEKAETVEEIDGKFITFLSFIKKGISYNHYDDDGKTKAYKKDEDEKINIEIIKEEGHLKAKVVFDDKSKVEEVKLIIYDDNADEFQGKIDRNMTSIILEKVANDEK